MAILVKQGGGSEYSSLAEHEYRDEKKDLRKTFIHGRDQILGMIRSLSNVKSSIYVEELDNTDVVLIGSDGSIFLVETKLGRNNDARRVHTQILDYATRFKTMSFEEFEKKWHVRSKGKHLSQELKERFGNETAQYLKENWKKEFNLIVVMDSISEGIGRIGKDLREHGYFVYGVELKRYSADNGLELLNPQIYWDTLTESSPQYKWKPVPNSSDFINSYSKTVLKDQITELVSFFDDLKHGKKSISSVDVLECYITPKQLNFKFLNYPISACINIDPTSKFEAGGIHFYVLKNITKVKLEKLSMLLKEHGITPRPLPKGTGKIGIWDFKKSKFSKERFEALLKAISSI